MTLIPIVVSMGVTVANALVPMTVDTQPEIAMTVQTARQVPMTVAVDTVNFSMDVATQDNVEMAIGATYVMGTGTPYTGRYVFTPTTETQTVEINGKTATRNITINPIPNNYGLITWNGSTLTVS